MNVAAVVSFAFSLLCALLVLFTVTTLGPVNLSALGMVLLVLGLLLAHLPVYRDRAVNR